MLYRLKNLCILQSYITCIVTEQELKDEVDFVLGDGEDDKSVLKRDAVFAKLNFCLNNGSFKVLGNKTVADSRKSISH